MHRSFGVQPLHLRDAAAPLSTTTLPNSARWRSACNQPSSLRTNEDIDAIVDMCRRHEPPLFSSLSHEALRSLASHLTLTSFRRGQFLYREETAIGKEEQKENGDNEEAEMQRRKRDDFVYILLTPSIVVLTQQQAKRANDPLGTAPAASSSTFSPPMSSQASRRKSKRSSLMRGGAPLIPLSASQQASPAGSRISSAETNNDPFASSTASPTPDTSSLTTTTTTILATCTGGDIIGSRMSSNLLHLSTILHSAVAKKHVTCLCVRKEVWKECFEKEVDLAAAAAMSDELPPLQSDPLDASSFSTSPLLTSSQSTYTLPSTSFKSVSFASASGSPSGSPCGSPSRTRRSTLHRQTMSRSESTPLITTQFSNDTMSILSAGSGTTPSAPFSPLPSPISLTLRDIIKQTFSTTIPTISNPFASEEEVKLQQKGQKMWHVLTDHVGLNAKLRKMKKGGAGGGGKKQDGIEEEKEEEKKLHQQQEFITSLVPFIPSATSDTLTTFDPLHSFTHSQHHNDNLHNDEDDDEIASSATLLKRRLHFFRNLHSFSGGTYKWSYDRLMQWCDCITERTIRGRQRIYSQGDNSEEVYFIQKGSVLIQRRMKETTCSGVKSSEGIGSGGAEKGSGVTNIVSSSSNAASSQHYGDYYTDHIPCESHHHILHASSSGSDNTLRNSSTSSSSDTTTSTAHLHHTSLESITRYHPNLGQESYHTLLHTCSPEIRAEIERGVVLVKEFDYVARRLTSGVSTQHFAFYSTTYGSAIRLSLQVTSPNTRQTVEMYVSTVYLLPGYENTRYTWMTSTAATATQHQTQSKEEGTMGSEEKQQQVHHHHTHHSHHHPNTCELLLHPSHPSYRKGWYYITVTLPKGTNNGSNQTEFTLRVACVDGGGGGGSVNASSTSSSIQSSVSASSLLTSSGASKSPSILTPLASLSIGSVFGLDGILNNAPRDDEAVSTSAETVLYVMKKEVWKEFFPMISAGGGGGGVGVRPISSATASNPNRPSSSSSTITSYASTSAPHVSNEILRQMIQQRKHRAGVHERALKLVKMQESSTATITSIIGSKDDTPPAMEAHTKLSSLHTQPSSIDLSLAHYSKLRAQHSSLTTALQHDADRRVQEEYRAGRMKVERRMGQEKKKVILSCDIGKKRYGRSGAAAGGVVKVIRSSTQVSRHTTRPSSSTSTAVASHPHAHSTSHHTTIHENTLLEELRRITRFIQDQERGRYTQEKWNATQEGLVRREKVREHKERVRKEKEEKYGVDGEVEKRMKEASMKKEEEKNGDVPIIDSSAPLLPPSQYAPVRTPAPKVVKQFTHHHSQTYLITQALKGTEQAILRAEVRPESMVMEGVEEMERKFSTQVESPSPNENPSTAPHVILPALTIYTTNDTSMKNLYEWNQSDMAQQAREREFENAKRAGGGGVKNIVDVRNNEENPTRTLHGLASGALKSGEPRKRLISSSSSPRLLKSWPALTQSTSSPMLLLMPGVIDSTETNETHTNYTVEDETVDTSIFDLTSVDAHEESTRHNGTQQVEVEDHQLQRPDTSLEVNGYESEDDQHEFDFDLGVPLPSTTNLQDDQEDDTTLTLTSHRSLMSTHFDPSSTTSRSQLLTHHSTIVQPLDLAGLSSGPVDQSTSGLNTSEEEYYEMPPDRVLEGIPFPMEKPSTERMREYATREMGVTTGEVIPKPLTKPLSLASFNLKQHDLQRQQFLSHTTSSPFLALQNTVTHDTQNHAHTRSTSRLRRNGQLQDLTKCKKDERIKQIEKKLMEEEHTLTMNQRPETALDDYSDRQQQESKEQMNSNDITRTASTASLRIDARSTTASAQNQPRTLSSSKSTGVLLTKDIESSTVYHHTKYTASDSQAMIPQRRPMNGFVPSKKAAVRPMSTKVVPFVLSQARSEKQIGDSEARVEEEKTEESASPVDQASSGTTSNPPAKPTLRALVDSLFNASPVQRTSAWFATAKRSTPFDAVNTVDLPAVPAVTVSSESQQKVISPHLKFNTYSKHEDQKEQTSIVPAMAMKLQRAPIIKQAAATAVPSSMVLDSNRPTKNSINSAETTSHRDQPALTAPPLSSSKPLYPSSSPPPFVYAPASSMNSYVKPKMNPYVNQPMQRG